MHSPPPVQIGKSWYDGVHFVQPLAAYESTRWMKSGEAGLVGQTIRLGRKALYLIALLVATETFVRGLHYAPRLVMISSNGAAVSGGIRRAN